MSQSNQSNPTVSANINGANQQVNLRDYLNIRVAPFLKKAITESLDAAPEFPLQWLGENLIHQSMLYEGNPDSTNIKERFLYKFESPAPAPATVVASAPSSGSMQPESDPKPAESAPEPASVPVTNGTVGSEPVPAQDTQMSDQINGGGGDNTARTQQENSLGDTEMTETS